MQALLNNQTNAIEKLQPLKVGALFKRPGTGKSRSAIELIRSVKSIDYILWLAPYRSIYPKVAGTGIKDEVEKWGGFDCKIDFIGIESLQNSDRIYLEIYNKLQSRKSFIVCDESLLIKNSDAKRTKRIIEFGKIAEYKLILNGTPISRNLLDIWAQMEFLSPKILNMDNAEFENTFCEWTKITKRIGNNSQTKKFITKYHNIDYLYSLIRPYVYEADLQLLVKQQHHEISYTISDDIKKEYEELKKKYLDNEVLQFMNNNIFLEMTMKMQHLYSCSENKFDVAKKIIDEHGAENVVIYRKFIDSHEELKKRFPNVTILSLQSDSRSINLQSKHVTIEWDKTWDFGVVDQYQLRTYRTGQNKDCYYYYLNGDVKLEGLIRENNNKKQSMLEYFKCITKEELKEIL